MRRLLPLILIAAAAGGPACAQQPAASAQQAPSLAPGEARETALDLADKLEFGFVFPETGRRYAAALRAKAAAGDYDDVADWKALSEVLTADVQAVAPDGHFRVMAGRPGPPPPPAEGATAPAPPPRAIEEAKWLAPGVAYIRFAGFPGDPATVAAADAFMAAHADAGTLIVDIRTHGGGGLGEMDAVLPYLYARPTGLVVMDTRAQVEREHGAIMPDGPTLRRLEGSDDVISREHHVAPHPTEQRLHDAKVYLLTANRTGSAAEHFALALKRTGRATLIGQPTAGAGHFGGFAPIAKNFAAFIPVGRTYDPDTGKGWEGVGVAPDVVVPAERALVEALTRAGVAAAEAERLSASVAPDAKEMERWASR